MRITYYDESGDDGYPNYSSPLFALSALYMHYLSWQINFERVRDFRRLIALGWFLQLGPDGPATPHNPAGTLERQADRLLQLLG